MCSERRPDTLAHASSALASSQALTSLDLFACAASSRRLERRAGSESGGSRGFFFFPLPPPEEQLHGRSLRDLLALQHLRLLNEAFCGVYNAHCPRGEAGVACPDVAAPVARHWSRKPVGRLDPRSPLVSYWDEASCGPRGDDAVSRATAECGGEGYSVVARVPYDESSRGFAATDESGCNYYAYLVHECDAEAGGAAEGAGKSALRAAAIAAAGPGSALDAVIERGCSGADRAECSAPAKAGHCLKNFEYMTFSCPRACGLCRFDARELDLLLGPRKFHGELAADVRREYLRVRTRLASYLLAAEQQARSAAEDPGTPGTCAAPQPDGSERADGEHDGEDEVDENEEGEGGEGGEEEGGDEHEEEVD